MATLSSPSQFGSAWDKRALKLLGQAGKRGIPLEGDAAYTETLSRLISMNLLVTSSRTVERQGKVTQEDFFKTNTRGDLAVANAVLDKVKLDLLQAQPMRGIPVHRRRNMEAVRLGQRTRSYTEALILKTVGSISDAPRLDSGWVHSGPEFSETPVGRIIGNLTDRTHGHQMHIGSVYRFDDVGFSMFEAIGFNNIDIFRALDPQEGCPEGATITHGMVYALTRYDGGAVTILFNTPGKGPYFHIDRVPAQSRGFVLASCDTMMMHLMMELR